MYMSTKTYGHEVGLSCCFRQWRAKSHCSELHGYAISVKLEFGAKDLDETNWVVDFGSLKEVKKFLELTFDHTLLVAQDDPHLDTLCELSGLGVARVVVLPAVGCEAFARIIFDRVAEWVTKNYGARCWLDSVEVREHGANSAIALQPAKPLCR